MKMITCGEGGAAYIKNTKILNSFSQNLYLGLSNNQQSGLSSSKKVNKWWSYQLKSYGTRSVFTELDAAIGIPQIRQIKKILDKRERLKDLYYHELRNQKNILILKNVGGLKYSNYFFTIYAKKGMNLLIFY